MSSFKFNEDFANNWCKGQIVPCQERENSFLVDGVALVSKDELLKHGEFIAPVYQVVTAPESEDTDYDRDFRVGDLVRHFKGGIYKIIAFGTHTETMEQMVVYQSVTDDTIWVRPKDLFMSVVDEEKYPNAEQPYRLIKVRIA